jgi:hypothetical protein
MKIIYTSALIENQFEVRKNQYIESYNSLCKFLEPNEIFIIECFSKTPNFLLELTDRVFLSSSHDPSIRNKGVLELMAIRNFLTVIPPEEEMIIKITGRYKLLSDFFLNQIYDNPGYDFYGKLVDDGSQIFTGCFCCTESILREFIDAQDLVYLERNMVNIEKSLLDFLQNRGKKCFYVEDINILSPIFGTGEIETLIL